MKLTKTDKGYDVTCGDEVVGTLAREYQPAIPRIQRGRYMWVMTPADGSSAPELYDSFKDAKAALTFTPGPSLDMTEAEAYPGRTYSDRLWAQYQPGDLVNVGPGYQQGGTYRASGAEGPAVVVGSIGRHDLKVRKGDTPGPWDYIITTARLTPR